MRAYNDTLRQTNLIEDAYRRSLFIDDRLRPSLAVESAIDAAMRRAQVVDWEKARVSSLADIAGNPALTGGPGDLAKQNSWTLDAISSLKSQVALGALAQTQVAALVGPLDEVRRIEDHLRTFALPAVDAARRLSSFYFGAIEPTALAQLRDYSSSIARAMACVGTPWLDVQNQLSSISAFSELQRIGLSVNAFPAFDRQLADGLRQSLGDWRDVIEWPKNLASDAIARTSFYHDRGLDLGLTDFPEPAFRESASLAGLDYTPPPFLPEFYVPGEEQAQESADDDEEGFRRTNAAHDRLQRFESHLRRFIASRMREAFGEDWIRHNIPGEMRDKWTYKKETAAKAGEADWPLIAYADFTDYLTIVTRNDNWNTVFKQYFARPESVRESFQRLNPIRLCTMHARLITQDDELYLLVETKRILKAIEQ
jgi:hypothetical protein